MFLVGLTGGIATGKSTVCKKLIELGCPVIDADQIARDGKWLNVNPKWALWPCADSGGNLLASMLNVTHWHRYQACT